MEECPKQAFIDFHNQKYEREQEYSGNSIEDIEYQNRRVEWAEFVVKISDKCESCGQITVDLSTGKLYCGREAPKEVIASNETILNN